MNKTLGKNDVFLLPGEFHFGDKDDRIITLLGSCVAITLWHPKKRIGGMCHYMLPSPINRETPLELNGKYAEDAVQMFMKAIKVAGTSPCEYQVKVFGAGNMFSALTSGPESCNPDYKKCIGSLSCKKISCKNRLMAAFLLQKYGFNIINHDLGGTQYRKVIFELWSGDVWQRKGS